MSIIPPGFAQVTYKHVGSAAPHGSWVTHGCSVNVLDDPIEIAAVGVQAWQDWVQPRTSSEVVLLSVAVKFGPNDTGPSAELAAVNAGDLVLASVPPNTTYLWSKNTAAGGKRNRGRMYWPGPPESYVDQGGNILPAQHDLDVIGAAGFLAAWQADGREMVILHDSEAFAPTVVTSITPSGLVATQRRRMRR